MAGDWIKMRNNLWDDPRIAKVGDLTKTSEATVIGGLYWLWATADQHTEDGVLSGMSLSTVNRKTGIKGFAEALVAVGWIADHPEGIRIIRFDEHNGASAKNRSQTARRVAKHANGKRVSNSSPKQENANATVVSDALAREEKRREEVNQLSEHTEVTQPEVQPNRAGAVCVALKSEGMGSVNPQHPELIALLANGVEIQEFIEAGRIAKARGKGFDYTLGIVKRQREDTNRLASDALAKPINGGSHGKQSRIDRLADTAAELTGASRARVIDGTAIAVG